MQPRIRLISFDANGTLIEPKTSVGKTYADAALLHGISLNAEAVQPAFFKHLKAMTQRAPAFGAASRPPIAAREWWREVVHNTMHDSLAAPSSSAHLDQKFGALFPDLYEHFALETAWRQYNGISNLLQELKSDGFALAVTSNFDDRLHGLLSRLQLRPLLSHVVLSSEVGADKPSPLIFQALLRQANVAPHEVLHVGNDRERDLEGAQAAGLAAMLVEPGQLNLSAVRAQLSVLASSRSKS
jgi:putative hydrolase of the HAD superfamily